ncbi:MAG: hypothetical protein IIT45_08805 [Treponema sp.]|nr:hypothetical protein [Treponema sp.]
MYGLEEELTSADWAFLFRGINCSPFISIEPWNLAEEEPAIPKQKIKRQSAITAKDPIRRVFVILFMATYYTFF